MSQRNMLYFIYYLQPGGRITLMNLDDSEQTFALDYTNADLLAHMSALNNGQDGVISITSAQLKNTIQ